MKRLLDTLQQKLDVSRFVAILCLLMVLSVTMNVLLAFRLRNLTVSRATARAESQLRVGSIVPPIPAKQLDGQLEVVSYEGVTRPTVLYIFTPPCTWCARNLENLKTLLDKTDGRYRFIGLSLSEETLAEYVAKNDLKLPVYSGLSPETIKIYKLGSTPQTLVISPEGKILKNWVGAYVGDQKISG